MVDNKNLVIKLVDCCKYSNVCIAGVVVSDGVDEFVGSRVRIVVCEEAERLAEKCHELRVFSNSQLLVVFEHSQGGSKDAELLGIVHTQAYDKRLAGIRIVVRHAVSAV